MKLPNPGPTYDLRDQAKTRGLLEAADRDNRKTGRDLDLSGGERLVMVDTVTGERGALSIVSGVVTWTAL